MKLSALKNEFVELLYNACLVDIACLKENFSGNNFFSIMPFIVIMDL